MIKTVCKNGENTLGFYFHLGPKVRVPVQYQMVKNLPAMQETQFDPWVGKIPWRKEW